MPVPFSAVVTPQSVIVTSPDGKTHTVCETHVNFDQVREKLRAYQAARREQREEDAETLSREIVGLIDLPRVIEDAGNGVVEVRHGVVFYRGEPIHGAIAERILWGIREGYDMTPQMRFVENLMENPSKRAVDELYGFIERHRMGISEDGHILAYKRVRDDFLDIYTGTIDNSPGQTPSMLRNRVDDDPTTTCSTGLHFCSMSYLPSYGARDGNRIVIVKVHPRDVVSVPVDYNAAKVRCCRYEVLSEYEGSDREDLLARKPIWFDSDFTGDGEDDGEDGDDWLDNYEGDDSEDDAMDETDNATTDPGPGCGPNGERCDDCQCDTAPKPPTTETPIGPGCGPNGERCDDCQCGTAPTAPATDGPVTGTSVSTTNVPPAPPPNWRALPRHP